MTIEAKIVADSLAPKGTRLTTLQLRYPKFIHGEFMTHRVFSRNASSSRAIPVERLIQDVIDDPVVPVYWGANEKGMQARSEVAEPFWIKEEWLNARDDAVKRARELSRLGLHKQIVNRLIEPFYHINVVVSATEWDNFFALRCHPDAQPEMRALAEAIRSARENSTPYPLKYGEWHLPYAFFSPMLRERFMPSEWPLIGPKLSAARCARVSYLTHEGKEPSVEEDLKLYERLASAVPMHASPMEHQATPEIWDQTNLCGNFVGWRQLRKLLEAKMAPYMAP